MRFLIRKHALAAAFIATLPCVAIAQEQDNSGISPYGAQAFPRNRALAGPPVVQPAPGRISPYGAEAYPAKPRGPNDPISAYGAQAYPAKVRGPNDPISPYGAEAFPYRPGAAAGQAAAAQPVQQPAAQGVQRPIGPIGQVAAIVQGKRVAQEPAAYSLEDQGAWHRAEGMPASMGNPTQLAPGTYAAPPVPPGTVFQNLGIPPLSRPKSTTPPKRASDLYGMYPQTAVGTWVLKSGGQWGMSQKDPDLNGMQEYTFGEVTGAGILDVKADGTWSLQFAGKVQTGRWADAPDTVHLFGLDGEEQFAYWNSKGQLILEGKSGMVKASANAA